MEKVTLFFCDICGTFDCGTFLKINEEELNRLINNFKIIMKSHGTNKIIFSFVTTEDFNTVMAMENKLRLYIGDDIYIGEHFYKKGNQVVNKAHEIFEYIQTLKSHYYIDQNIYYADDCELYHYLLEELNAFFESKFIIHSIIPKKNGLFEVNDILEKSLTQSTITKICAK